MVRRQILPVHLVSDEDVGLHRPRPRDTAGIGDRTRRLFLGHAPISAFQNDVAHVVGQSGAFQRHGKGKTRPFGVADRAELAALRHLFDWMVIGQIMPTNPDAAVRGPRHIVRRGKTPVLDPAEARQLIELAR